MQYCFVLYFLASSDSQKNAFQELLYSANQKAIVNSVNSLALIRLTNYELQIEFIQFQPVCCLPCSMTYKSGLLTSDEAGYSDSYRRLAPDPWMAYALIFDTSGGK